MKLRLVLFLFLLGNLLGAQDPTVFDIRAYDTQLGIATGYLGLVLVAAHTVAPASYQIQVDTISHLGAQGYDNSWIMNSGFVGFGGMVAGSSLAYSIRTGRDWPVTVGIATWGLGILASGFASLSSFEEGIPFDSVESNLHSVFATAAGVGISGAALGLVITDPDPKRKFVHGAALAFISLTSAMTGLMPEYTGVWQRVLWTGSLAWLNWTYATDLRNGP